MRDLTAEELGVIQEWIPSIRCAAVVTIMDMIDRGLGDSVSQETICQSRSYVLQPLQVLGVTEEELQQAAVAITSPLRQLLVNMR